MQRVANITSTEELRLAAKRTDAAMTRQRAARLAPDRRSRGPWALRTEEHGGKRSAARRFFHKGAREMRSKMRAARADSHACVRLFAGRDASESDGHEEHDEAMVRRSERARTGGESRDDLAAAAAIRVGINNTNADIGQYDKLLSRVLVLPILS